MMGASSRQLASDDPPKPFQPAGAIVTGSLNSLQNLGWSEFFEDQRQPDDFAFEPCRIASVHRSRLTAMSPAGLIKLTLPVHAKTGDFAVGDWVLVDHQTHLLSRRLDRKSVMSRHPEGAKTPQLFAANVDTLFIVTSCNADFNPARLERYLALANQAATNPVILLTKVDATDDAEAYRQKAAALQRDLAVVTLAPYSLDAATALAPWCGVGQTVALVGSSGVGKSTLVNRLAGTEALPQRTAEVRENDAKGRHTTTSRSISRHCGRRLGDRHAGNAFAPYQQCGAGRQHPVRGNHRACPAVQVPRLHSRP